MLKLTTTEPFHVLQDPRVSITNHEDAERLRTPWTFLITDGQSFSGYKNSFDVVGYSGSIGYETKEKAETQRIKLHKQFDQAESRLIFMLHQPNMQFVQAFASFEGLKTYAKIISNQLAEDENHTVELSKLTITDSGSLTNLGSCDLVEPTFDDTDFFVRVHILME